MTKAKGPLTPDILKPVAGVGAGQAAQRHHPRHEPQIGIRLTGLDKLVHLVGLGEVVPRLGRGVWIAFTGPPRLPEASPAVTNPFRLRAMARILSCPSDRKRAGFSAAEGKRGQGITSFRAALFWMGADSGRLSRRCRGGFPRRWRGGAEGEKGKPRPLAAIGVFCTVPKNRPNVICRWDRDCPDGPQLSRPAARAGMGTREELLRRRICRGVGCGAVFWICRHCDRGHRYCSDGCRQKTARQQGRDANRRHQQSQEGRLDHRDRQRDYRERRRRRVTDHTSAAPSGSDSIVTAELFRSEDGPGSVSGEDRYVASAGFEPACIICGRTAGSTPSKRPSFPDGH